MERGGEGKGKGKGEGDHLPYFPHWLLPQIPPWIYTSLFHHQMVATPTHSKKQEIISSRKKPYKKLNHGWRAGRRTCAMQWRGWSPKNTPLPTCYRIEFGRSTSTGLGIRRWTPKNGIMGLPRRISVLFCWAILSMVKVVMWSRGGGVAHLTKPGWSKPYTHSTPN